MSGAGKSTLIDLVPRFHDVTAGRITLDGHDLRDVTQASLRAQIGVVTQENFLFSDTIRYNIAYGDRKSTRLNSSHSQISYAVFCLKKKKKTTHQHSHLSIISTH